MTPIPLADADAAANPAPAWRRLLVFLVGLILVLSSGVHGILGWKMVHQALLDAGTPVDLVDTVRLGWHFGSVSMAAFGVIVILAWSGMRAAAWPLRPGLVIAAAYVLFGVAATIASGFSLHFIFLFALPGLLLLVGLSGRR
jgi:hypothetical protein